MEKQKIQKKLKTTSFHLLWQPLLCGLFIWFVLLVLNQVPHTSILWAAGASSLASSAFIVFVTPKAYVAKWRRVIGGYVLALISGEIMQNLFRLGYRELAHHALISHQLFSGSPAFWVAGALAVSMTLFLMVVFRLEHPPAAGIALVLVIDVKGFYFLGALILSALLLSFIKYLLRYHLKSLVN